MKARLKLHFPLLSDSQRAVMKLYGTHSLSKYRSKGRPYDAATLVLIDKAGTIRWIYQNADYRGRASISLDLAKAKKLK